MTLMLIVQRLARQLPIASGQLALRETPLPLLATGMRPCVQPSAAAHFSKRISESPDFELRETTMNAIKMSGRTVSEQTTYISDTIEKSGHLSAQEWDKFFSEILSRRGYQVNSENMTAIVMGFCLAHSNWKSALSLFTYLQSKDSDINIGTISKFLKVCHKMWPQSTEADILKAYDLLKSRMSFMDANTAESCASAVSLTQRWREALDLLESVKLTCSPGSHSYSAVVDAAFRHGEDELGWSMAAKAMESGKKPTPSVYETWLLADPKKQPSLDRAQKLFEFLSEHSVIIPKETAISISKYIQRLTPKWRGNLIKINQKAVCGNCGEALQSIQLSQAQFKQLRDSFLSNVVLGRDIFARSRPEEIESFQSFVRSSQPYDVVIDGLNVAYVLGSQNNRLQCKTLVEAVDRFVYEGARVVVLGRKHMLSWPKQEMNFIKQNSSLFLAENLTHDDLLILHATLQGGPDTYFVSRDLMRGHAHRLGDPKLGHLFRRWQQCRQYQPHASKITGKIHFTEPLDYLPEAQKREVDGRLLSWHIPYQEVADESTIILELPRTWLCLKPQAAKAVNVKDLFES